MLARFAESPLPVVAGCTGHALAMGALLLLGADLRLGAAGDFKIGLNETAIGMVLPDFAIQLVEERLSRRHRLRVPDESRTARRRPYAGYCCVGH